MPELLTPRHRIAWSYANLARAHAALTDGVVRYATKHHMIRSRLFKGLCEGSLSMRSIYDDEREKLVGLRCCEYCAKTTALTIDHLFSRKRGGTDSPQNLVVACAPCNSSKGDRDMLAWLSSSGRFPTVLLLRRYLKNAAAYLDERELLDVAMAEIEHLQLPFALDLLPFDFPPLESLKLRMAPLEPPAI